MSVLRSGLFAGQSAVVTGGGSGIGFAVARELAHLGCNVVIAGRNSEKLKASASRLFAEGSIGSVNYKTCNIRNEDEVHALMAFAVDSHGSLDLLVNNAGGQFPSPAVSIKRKGWDAVIETNLTGTFQCCREAYAAGLRSRCGLRRLPHFHQPRMLLMPRCRCPCQLHRRRGQRDRRHVFRLSRHGPHG